MNVLAIDQGTSSTKAAVVDGSGRVLARAESAVTTDAIGERGVQFDPEALYRSVVHAGRSALEAAGTTVGAVGVANQGESVLAWDRASGVPAGPGISWQDRRAAPGPPEVAARAARLHAISGLPLDPYFAAPKMRWLQDAGARGVLTTSDTWLLHRLTGAFVTDVTTASRTMLLDLDERRWSEEAASIFGIGFASLPEVVDCTTAVGETEAFGAAVPVCGLAVDQQAALFGEGCVRAGDAKCTLGTGAFLLVNMGERACRSEGRLSASVAWEGGGTAAYCLDGQVYSVGAAFDWLVRLGVLESATGLDQALAEAPDAGAVQVVPAFAGLGAPHWRSDVRASIEGLELATTASQLVRATVEGVTAQIAELVDAVRRDGVGLGCLRVDGGLTASAGFLQDLADMTQLPVEVFASPDATLLGIAALAVSGARGAGAPVPFDPPGAPRSFEPVMDPDHAALRRHRFGEAVDRVIERSDSP